NGLSEHGLVADHDVTERVVADVTLVRGTRRVGIHAKHVVALARVLVIDVVGPLVEPDRLPLLLSGNNAKRAAHYDILGNKRPSLSPRENGNHDRYHLHSRPRRILRRGVLVRRGS